jgi:AcrR family transcriptional regulator
LHDRQAADTLTRMQLRDRIIVAAGKVFAEHGYRGATTRRIAEAAGVNEVTLFRQFGSKAELIREAVGYAQRNAAPGFKLPARPERPREELTAWAADHLARLRGLRAMIRTCMGESTSRPEILARVREGRLRTRAELRGYLARLAERGLVVPGTNLDAAAGMLMGALFSDVMSRDLVPELFHYPEEEAATLYVDLLLRALASGACASSSTEPAHHGEER